MTLPQIWNALHEGEIPEPGVREFSSLAEARTWRRERDARVAAARARREAEARRREVAAWRKARRGY